MLQINIYNNNNIINNNNNINNINNKNFYDIPTKFPVITAITILTSATSTKTLLFTLAIAATLLAYVNIEDNMYKGNGNKDFQQDKVYNNEVYYTTGCSYCCEQKTDTVELFHKKRK